jgi:hypothetical protein
MALTITLDWLAGTFHGVSENETKFINRYARTNPIQTIKPRNGYSIAEVDSNGVQLLWNPDRTEMGVHCIFPGSALRVLYEQQSILMSSLLREFTEAGAKISRLDLAKDLTLTPVDLAAVYKSLEQGANVGTARTFSTILSGDGGQTVYVGSRTSEKFIRIYNKAAQEGLTDRHWTRYELETKGMVARALASLLTGPQDWGAIFDATTNGMLYLGARGPLYGFKTQGATSHGLPKLEKQTDREAWISSQVIAAVARHYIDNPNSEAVQRLLATLQLIDKQRKLGD